MALCVFGGSRVFLQGGGARARHALFVLCCNAAAMLLLLLLMHDRTLRLRNQHSADFWMAGYTIQQTRTSPCLF